MKHMMSVMHTGTCYLVLKDLILIYVELTRKVTLVMNFMVMVCSL